MELSTLSLPVFRARRTLRTTLCQFGVGLLSLTEACAGDSGTTGPSGGGTFTAAVSAVSVTVGRSATGTLTFTIARGSGFTGLVTCSVSGLPNGVTGAFLPQVVLPNQTSTVLTLSASTTAVTGIGPFSVKCSSPDAADQNISLSVNVTSTTALGPFSLAVSAPSLLVVQNVLTTAPLVTITRDAGFTGSVSLAVTGLPTLLAGGLSPAAVTGSTARFNILSAGQANGTYTATIRGTSTGVGEASTTIQIVVASPTTGSIQWNFCQLPPWFVAVRDGAAGPWTRVVPSGTGFTHNFSIAASSGAVAVVSVDSGVARTTVYQGSTPELTAIGAAECAVNPPATTRAVPGTVTGMAATEVAYIGMGGWTQSVFGNGSYSMLNLASGPLDLLATRTTTDVSLNSLISRMILRRGLNPAAGASNAVLDFNGSEAFAPSLSTWTFGNTNGEQFSTAQSLLTAGGSAVPLNLVPAFDRPPTTRTIYGVPAAQTLPGDLHQVIATMGTVAVATARPTRQVVAYVRNVVDRTLNFGPTMPAPTVSVASSAQGRFRFQGTLPAEYNAGLSINLKSNGTTPRFATLHTTRAFLANNTTYDVQMPDLNGILGWDTDWQVRPGSLTNWWASGGGEIFDFYDARNIFSATRVRWVAPLVGAVAPVDGATFVFGRAFGTATP